MERKLAAILAADVVGYSRLMGVDEEATLGTLKAYREIVDGLIVSHAGRVFGSAGDSVIAEFASPVEAVRCAVDIQQDLEQRNAALSAERRMQFRIGVNLGDVMVEGSNLLGDGVNIAARIEGLADPGGICLSDDIYRQVRSKLHLGFEDLGEHRLKNIAEPVRVFRVPVEAGEAAPTEAAPVPRPADELGDKPSIAVLPFDNMSGDPEQEYFADGITEDIITEVSRFRDLFVIARNTTFTYKGKAVDVKRVGRELGVRYVVEGSVRKAGNRVRITVQLINAEDGHHLWAERYDRDLEDVFAVQDEISQAIVAVLPLRLEAAHLERAKRKLTDNMVAYDYLLRAKDFHHRFTAQDNIEGQRMVDKAIELDPGYAQAWAWRACILGQAFVRGYSDDMAKVMKELIAAAEEVRRLDDDDSECHRILTELYLYFRKDFDKAESHQNRAITLNPNDPRIVSQRGEVLTWLGRADEAVEWIEKAMRLDPSNADKRSKHLGHALFVIHRYDEAIKAYKRVPEIQADQHTFMAACYAQLGRQEEAQAHTAKLLEMKPDFSVREQLKLAPYKNPPDLEHLREAALKAGLPD